MPSTALAADTEEIVMTAKKVTYLQAVRANNTAEKLFLEYFKYFQNCNGDKQLILRRLKREYADSAYVFMAEALSCCRNISMSAHMRDCKMSMAITAARQVLSGNEIELDCFKQVEAIIEQRYEYFYYY